MRSELPVQNCIGRCGSALPGATVGCCEGHRGQKPAPTGHFVRRSYAVCIEGDLRAVFYVEGNIIWSVDIGTHAIYRV